MASMFWVNFFCGYQYLHKFWCSGDDWCWRQLELVCVLKQYISWRQRWWWRWGWVEVDDRGRSCWSGNSRIWSRQLQSTVDPCIWLATRHNRFWRCRRHKTARICPSPDSSHWSTAGKFFAYNFTVLLSPLWVIIFYRWYVCGTVGDIAVYNVIAVFTKHACSVYFLLCCFTYITWSVSFTVWQQVIAIEQCVLMVVYEDFTLPIMIQISGWNKWWWKHSQNEMKLQ